MRLTSSLTVFVLCALCMCMQLFFWLKLEFQTNMVICVHIRIPDFFWNISYLGGYFISNKQLQSGAYLTYLKLHHEGIHNTADYGNEIEGVPAVPKIALISRRVYIRGFRGRKANREIRSRVKQNGSKVQFTWDQNILHTGTLTHYMTFITKGNVK